MFVTGLCMLAVGVLADRWRSLERFMVAGYALNALCTFAYLLVATPLHLLLVQAGLGVASALATPTWNALYAANTPPQQSGASWGAAHGRTYLITGIAIMLGGYVVYVGSFTLLFAIMGMIQLIAALYQAQILRTPSVSL